MAVESDLLFGLCQFVRDQLSFPRKCAGAIEILSGNRSSRLFRELPCLIDHILLAGRERAPGDLLEVLFCRGQHLIDSVSFLGCLVADGSAREVNVRL